MLHDSPKGYLRKVEKAVVQLGGIYVERYEEEILSSNRINLRIRIRFKSGATLEMSEAVIAVSESVSHLGYRYHFQNSNNCIVFRYDNTPHFRDLPTSSAYTKNGDCLRKTFDIKPTIIFSFSAFWSKLVMQN